MNETQLFIKKRLITFLPNLFIRKLINSNYYFARAYYLHTLRLASKRYNTPPLLVHQMGKVASSSVAKSLNAANLGLQIYHTHFLRPEMTEKYEKRRREYLGTKREGRLLHIWQYRYLYQRLQHDLKSGKRWRVITLIRDPIARNISDFFENMEITPTASTRQRKFSSIEYDFDIVVKDNDFTELIGLFLEKFPHDYPANFLDYEIEGVFNVDLYESDFPADKGFKIYRGNQADVLLLRVENLTDCFTVALKEFLNIENLTLSNNTNIGSKKAYAETYRLFIESISFSESYIDRIYSTNFIKHFYTSTEINQFKARWLNTTSND